MRTAHLASILTALITFACSSDDSGAGGSGGSDPGASSPGGSGTGGQGTAGQGAGGSGSGVEQMMSELDAKGFFDNLDRFEPSESTTADGVSKHWFDVTADSPQCIDSSPFGLATRDQGSEDLVILLMGGGACWTGFSFCTTEVGSQIDALDGPVEFGIVDPADGGPTSTWNHVLVPYCDGSVFIGDRTADIVVGDAADPATAAFDGDEVMHGLKNLSAALDVAKASFPSARRILLAGVSAGGFGTIWATGLVRHLYPEAELLVFNDAGVGLAKPDDPSFQDFLQSEWGATDRFPASCTECEASPHVMPIVSWGLALDPNLSVSMFSAYGDDVIAGVFLNIPDPDFQAALLSESGKIHDAFPDRFRRFFIEGGQHTALSSWDTTTKGSVVLRDWTIGWLEGDDATWADLP